MTKREMYHTWLNNAYAMEQDLIKTLEAQLDDFEDYPDVREAIEDHIADTKDHAEKVKEIMKRNGFSVSAVKSGMANLAGIAKGGSMDLMHDKAVKNMLSDYASENMEIASYNALIVSAKEVGDEESIEVFEEILSDEQAMIEIIDGSFSDVVKKFLDTHED